MFGQNYLRIFSICCLAFLCHLSYGQTTVNVEPGDDIFILVIAGMDQKFAVGFTARAKRARLHANNIAGTRDFVGTGVVVNQRDKIRTVTGEISSGSVGTVVQRLDRVGNALSCCFSDIRLVVNNTRHCLY